MVALLVASVVELNRLAVADIEVSGHFADDKEMLFLVISGVNVAKEILNTDAFESDYDTLLELWARSKEYFQFASAAFERGIMEGEIIDENGKIDVNSLISDNGQFDQTQKAILERFLGEPRFGLTEEEVNTIIDSLRDWIDEDDEISGIYGAEDSFYHDRGYLCKNAPLDTLEEMLLIRGVTQEIFYGNRERSGIAPYLTVYGTHELNINTASIPVLMALSSDMSEDLATQMDKFRKDETNEGELTSSAWYRRIWPYANPLPEKYLTVISDAFTVRMKVSFGQSEKEIKAVVSRSEGRAEVIYWQELSS
jgi:general secretion pathway protein K